MEVNRIFINPLKFKHMNNYTIFYNASINNGKSMCYSFMAENDEKAFEFIDDKFDSTITIDKLVDNDTDEEFVNCETGRDVALYEICFTSDDDADVSSAYFNTVSQAEEYIHSGYGLTNDYKGCLAEITIRRTSRVVKSINL